MPASHYRRLKLTIAGLTATAVIATGAYLQPGSSNSASTTLDPAGQAGSAITTSYQAGVPAGATTTAAATAAVNNAASTARTSRGS